MTNTQQNNTQNKCLLLKLYKTSKTAEVHPNFRAKLASKTRHYPELEVFKIQLEEEQNDKHPHLYTEAKQKLFGYRLVFLAFALVFIALFAAVNYLSFNWNYSFFFDSWFKAKWVISSGITSLAIAALGCAFIPCSLHEATRHVVGKAKRSLKHIYEKQRLQHGISSVVLWGESYRKGSALRHMYNEVADKIQERGEDTYRLLKKIARTPALTKKAKERLYNQALAELHDKITFSVHSFKQLEFDSSRDLRVA